MGLDQNHYIFKKDSDVHIILLVSPPYHRNPNLAAQVGIFTHFQCEWETMGEANTKIDITPLDEKIKALPIEPGTFSPVLYKLMLPITESNRSLEKLRNIGIDASKFFPGLEGAVKALKELEISTSIKWTRKWPHA